MDDGGTNETIWLVTGAVDAESLGQCRCRRVASKVVADDERNRGAHTPPTTGTEADR